MFCTNCGTEVQDKVNFCPNCGKSVAAPHNPNFSQQNFNTQTGASYSRAEEPVRKLERSMNDKWIAGVCSGFARYFGVDLTLVRLVWLATVILAGTGVLAYLICWIVIPQQQQPTRAYSA